LQFTKHRDSLTKGYYNIAISYHPYTIRRSPHLPQYKVECITSGNNGETTDNMLDRLKKELPKYKNVKIVVIFGGMNDLASFSAESIIERIKAMHEYVISKQLISVLITIPQCLPV